ncbi:hypothetical protein BGW38_005130, partial [Lunasporangiospora selenospora]
VIDFLNSSATNNPPPAWHGYSLAIGIACLTLAQNLLYQRWNLGSVKLGIYIRSALIDMIFRKAATLSSHAHLVYSDGAIVNLMSTDVSRIDTACLQMMIVFCVPVFTCIIVGLLVHLMGPSALLGAGILILVNPLLGWAMSRLAPIRKKASQFTDNRIRLTSEVLQGIKVIKFFGWESRFLERLSEIRRNELKNVGKLLYIRGSVAAASAALPVLASSLSFVLYAATGNELKPEIIFPAIAYFTILRTPLMVLPSAYTLTVDAYVAIKRIEEFLLSEESKPLPPPDTNHPDALTMKNASFVWEQLRGASSDTLVPTASSGTDEKTGDESTPTSSLDISEDGVLPYLSRLNLSIPRGSLVAVVGPVGSGKSSLLQAMVGNMTLSSGRVIRGASMSYASQTAWIQNSTVRDNILFDTPYDETRYRRVLRACCLEADLRLLPAGDKTEIGERGVNLSGGQKARLSLARSVYFDAGMVIMDDPLSAVDAHVGKRLWQDCIMTELRERTRVIATQQLHVLPDVDYVIYMQNGKIAEEGTYKELIAKDGQFCALMAQYGGVHAEEEQDVAEEEEQKEENDEIISDGTPIKSMGREPFVALSSSQTVPLPQHSDEKKADIYENESSGKDEKPVEGETAQQKLMSDEERESGAVKGSVYSGYLKSSGWMVWFGVLSFFFLQQAANVLGNQWISWWSSDKFDLTTDEYMGIYVAWTLAQLVLVFAASLLLSFAVIKTAGAMHDNAFGMVLHSPLAFFDTTPLGRILNRFSKDVDTMDNVLWSTLYEFTITSVTVLGTVILIIVSFPWLALAVVVIAVLYYALSIYYRTTSREVKRLDSNMRSFLYAYFSECLTGLGTIKAYSMVNRAIIKNEHRIDLGNRPYYMFQVGSRWLSLRVNFLGATLSFSTVVLMTATRFSISPATAGLVLSYLARISGDLNWVIQRLATLENNMNSAERLVHYIENLEQERPSERPESKPKDIAWPSQGAVSFNNVSMRYRPGLPQVLQGISFDIKAGHKVGIVGRTGAGKSSLIHALFLLSEIDEGQVVIDGIDTTTLGTLDLRPRIGIIPQDPVLFHGTFRYNIDPMSLYTEQEIWQALETSDLKAYVQAQEGGLDSMIAANGDNLS